MTFGPNRRAGASGSYIVGIDLIKKQYVPVSGRIVPKGSSEYSVAGHWSVADGQRSIAISCQSLPVDTGYEVHRRLDERDTTISH